MNADPEIEITIIITNDELYYNEDDTTLSS